MASNYLWDAVEAVRAQLSEDDLPAEGGDSLLVAYALVLLLRGRSTSDRDIHNAWAAWKICDRQEDPDLVPFDQLDAETQDKDRKYAAAVQRAAEVLEGTAHP